MGEGEESKEICSLISLRAIKRLGHWPTTFSSLALAYFTLAYFLSIVTPSPVLSLLCLTLTPQYA